MSEVSFIAGGGANSIGCSAYVLKLGDFYLMIDYGGGYDSIYDEPQYGGPLDALLLSHGHHDHSTMVPRLCRKYPDLKVYTTAPTRELALLGWRDTLRIASRRKIDPPFSEDDIQLALASMQIIEEDKELKLTDDISVFPIHAGHILGATSFLITYKGEAYFFTNDICFHDRWLISGAPAISLERCRLLVRESTYINKSVGDREITRQKLVADAKAVLERRGRLLIPGLSIDRIQDVFGDLFQAGLWPIYIDGARKPTEVYIKYLGARAALLNDALRFKNDGQRDQFLASREPGIIIASSGMVYPNTPSAVWAESLLYHENDAIFIVNYQPPDTQGFLLSNAVDGSCIQWNDSIIRVNCERKEFSKSAHMDGPEGEELEVRLNPDTIIYTHGEDGEIDKYLASHQDGKQRIKALVGKEVEL